MWYTYPFLKSNLDFVIYNSDEKDGLTKRYVFNGKNWQEQILGRVVSVWIDLFVDKIIVEFKRLPP